MVGMANRPGGYQEDLIEYLQPFLGTCSNLIQALKNDQQRKKAEAALIDTLSRFNRLAENLTDFLIYSHGADGVFTYISPTITSVLGYTPKEFKCHYSEYLTDNPINQKVEYYTNLTLKGLKQPSYDLEIFHKNGSRCWLEISETPILNDQGKVIGIDGIAKNITERRNMEEKLNQAHNDLEQKNLALKEILSQIEIEKKQFGNSIAVNSEKLLLPLVNKLRKKHAGKSDKIFRLLEDNIKNLTSNFGGKLSGSLIKMSPKEIEICNLIKNGFNSKEISSFLCISIKTVDTHRRNIRLKLGLAGKKINLTSYLNSI